MKINDASNVLHHLHGSNSWSNEKPLYGIGARLLVAVGVQQLQLLLSSVLECSSPNAANIPARRSLSCRRKNPFIMIRARAQIGSALTIRAARKTALRNYTLPLVSKFIYLLDVENWNTRFVVVYNSYRWRVLACKTRQRRK